MSAELARTVLDFSQTCRQARLLMLVIALFTDESSKHSCLSIKRLSRLTNLPAAEVQKLLAMLEETGHLMREKRGKGHPTHYLLAPEYWAHLEQIRQRANLLISEPDSAYIN